MSIRVLEPGALTTVQDLGRPGWASSGVPPSGAMDTFAFRAANRLAGNPDGAAALEMTMIGPLLEFVDSAVVALAGAPFDTEIAGARAPIDEAFRVGAGSLLRIGKATSGCRAYLAVRGGIDVPVVLGSRSTYVAGGIGGTNGRRLAAHDYLRLGSVADAPLRRIASVLPYPSGEVRVIPGPQEAVFALTAFWDEDFRVTPSSDRTGLRLDGPRLEHGGSAEIDPEGLVAGAIQVPGDGLPIVLGPDHPATGGYAKVGTVITADLPAIAQARSGDTLRFVAVEHTEAVRALRHRESSLALGIEDIG